VINITFDLDNKEAIRAFANAMLGYAGLATVKDIDPPFERIPPVEQTEPVEVVETKDVVEPEPAAEVTLIPSTTDTVNVDTHGVAFNPEYCGKAKEPFYKAGRRKGQWKRRQGVDEKQYDLWYAEKLLEITPTEPGPVVSTRSDSAAAFAGEPAASPPATDTDVPQGAGELMRWVSEQMNAGNLTQADVDSAYATADVTPAQLFLDDANAVGKVYGVLQASLS